MCRGRYITPLSGDDYWINDQKLEVEVKFLDEHPQYVAAFNGIELRMNDEKTPYDTVPHDLSTLGREYTIKDYEKCIPLGTHGFFMRNYFLTEEGREYFAQAQQISKFVDDAVDEVLILKKGPVYILDIVTDAHRVVDDITDKKNYNSRYSRLEKFGHHIGLLNGMSERWGDEIDFSGWYAEYYATGFLSMILSRDFKGYKEVMATIPDRYQKPFFRSVGVRAVPKMISFVVGRFRRIKK